ncbi:hypothetical protein EZV61_10555 [Corallincola luteus]|uniref:Uncharacterized protein n=1 Tax=Corallincola luteus TaxID=1775177 RepID=A0ABY2AKG2_9GAMM|nr:hypothetical protein [Corallincola luteus]TCI03308.1 hypothetical protein EZV61_10555 [Corallincola luteus]
MLKRTAFMGVLLFCAAPTFAAEELAQDMLAEGISKLMYMNDSCGVTIEKEKVQEISKLYLYANGFSGDIQVDWEQVKATAAAEFEVLKKENPIGELCDKYAEQFESVLPLLKKHDATELDIE